MKISIFSSLIIALLSISLDSYAKDSPTQGEKFVALTFDDGPSKILTLKVLSILADNHAKATFFVLGNRVKSYPKIIEAIKAAGHEIGNHSYSHPTLPEQSEKEIAHELKKTNMALESHQVLPKWFRPPYGQLDASVKHSAYAMGMATALWSLDAQDYSGLSPQALQERVLSKIKSGDVILFHDTKENTSQALPGILKALLQGGYKFVTMSEWYQRVAAMKKPSRRIISILR